VLAGLRPPALRRSPRPHLLAKLPEASVNTSATPADEDHRKRVTVGGALVSAFRGRAGRRSGRVWAGHGRGGLRSALAAADRLRLRRCRPVLAGRLTAVFTGLAATGASAADQARAASRALDDWTRTVMVVDTPIIPPGPPAPPVPLS
jgi:hypothetical protein